MMDESGIAQKIVLYKQKKVSDTMTLKETQDDKDILILMMIQERDKQLEILEEENANLKRLLIESLRDNRHLEKLIRELKSKRNSKIDSIQNR